jgi:hypothetical protein
VGKRREERQSKAREQLARNPLYRQPGWDAIVSDADLVGIADELLQTLDAEEADGSDDLPRGALSD